MWLYCQIIRYDLERTNYKTIIIKKIKSINNKIEQNEVQYNLEWQTAKISTSSSGNGSKYEFLSSSDVLSEKDLLEKAVAIKRFEYSLLGKAFEKQTYVIEKQSDVINKKRDKRNKLLKTVIGKNEKYRDKVRNALLYLLKEQVEKYVEIDKRMKHEDLIYGKLWKI